MYKENLEDLSQVLGKVITGFTVFLQCYNIFNKWRLKEVLDSVVSWNREPAMALQDSKSVFNFRPSSHALPLSLSDRDLQSSDQSSVVINFAVAIWIFDLVFG